MGKALAGKDGTFKIGENAVGYVDDWSVDFTLGNEETNSLGESWKKHISTVKEFSLKFSGSLDPSDPAQRAMITAITGGDTEGLAVAFEFAHGASGANFKLSGAGVIDSCGITASWSGKVAYSIGMKGNGAPTYTGSASV